LGLRWNRPAVRSRVEAVPAEVVRLRAVATAAVVSVAASAAVRLAAEAEVAAACTVACPTPAASIR